MKKIDLTSIIICMIMLFPITTLFQYYISFSNIVLLVGVTFFLSLKMLSIQRIRRRYVYLLLFALTIWIVSVLNTSMPALKANKNMAIYYIFMIIFYIFFLNEKDKIWSVINGHKKYIFLIISIYTVLLTISIYLPFSYTQITAGGWGTEKYFVSFSGSPNRVGPACLFIMVLMVFLVQKNYNKKCIILMVLPHIYTVAMGGSRTYFVLGMCAALIIFYYGINNKKNFKLILPLLAVLFLIVVIRSNMINKIIATFQYGENSVIFWQKLTNTRSIFWVAQLKMFWNTSTIHHFFGNGINFTSYYYGLWAHSDFIEILCSYGYIGLSLYLILMYVSLSSFWQYSKSDKIIKIVVVFVWLFNAFFNFFYCYFCAMLSYPFLLMIVSKEKMIIDWERIFK